MEKQVKNIRNKHKVFKNIVSREEEKKFNRYVVEGVVGYYFGTKKQTEEHARSLRRKRSKSHLAVDVSNITGVGHLGSTTSSSAQS